MKIAIFSDCYLDLTGGITTSIAAQKKELEKRGHTVQVYSSAYPRSRTEDVRLARKNIFVVPSCRFIGRGIAPIARRPKVIEDWLVRYHPELEDYDCFYIHYEAGCSIAALRLAKKLHIPSIQVMHGREDMGESSIIPFGFRTFVASALNLFHSWYIPHNTKVSRDNYLADSFAKAKMWTLMVNHANFADYVVTPSEHFAKKLKHYGVKRQIKVLPNSVSDDFFEPNLKPRVLNSGDTLRIIWHSRISPEKRMMPFLKALRYVEDGYKLDVYGSGGDYSRARRYVRKNDLRVLFHGNVDFDSAYYKLSKSHLDILASYNFDTFGMTLIEAESAGVPSLFVDPDLKEVLPEGGYLFAEGPDPKSIAKAINYLISHPEELEKMSKVLLKHRDEVRSSRRIKELEKFIEEIKKSHKD